MIFIINNWTIYTDGGCRNTGNHSGGHVHLNNKSAYAFLIKENHKNIASGTKGFYGKTNNQMELSGVIYALLALLPYVDSKHDNFTIISDSKYIVNSVNKHWLVKWNQQHFYKRKNSDLWNMLFTLLKHFKNINFKWVKGHAHNKGNIYVDHLLNHSMDKLITR